MQQLKIACRLLLCLTLFTGFFYPLVITWIAQHIFPWQANGSLISHQGKIVGSEWIGQSFSSGTYFWGRPSATNFYPYNGLASSGSNKGPSNPLFLTDVYNRVIQLRHVNTLKAPIPVDLVTASASGLDPDITPAAAFYQAARIAQARHLPEEKINQLIQNQIKYRTFGCLGEPRVNVLQLNLALDCLQNATMEKKRFVDKVSCNALAADSTIRPFAKVLSAARFEGVSLEPLGNNHVQKSH